ncbi:MAG: ABC transporter permease [Planctomycetota bacterium]
MVQLHPLAEIARLGSVAPSPVTITWPAVGAALWLPLAPLSWAFRVRETPSLAARVLLPLAFLSIVGFAWERATRGDDYLARFSRLSPLDVQRQAIEETTLCPVVLETRERKLWTREPVLEIVAVTLPRGAYDARRDAIAGLAPFDVTLGTAEAPPVGLVTLEARPRAFFGERIPARIGAECEALARTRALVASLPGVALEERELPVEEAKRWLVIERAVVTRDVAATETARAALDAIVGAQGWRTTERADGSVVIAGAERKEERAIPSMILPSPRELADSIPSLLNQRWSTWADARAWWRGDAGAQPKGGAGPTALDRSRPSEVPFALAERVLAAQVGPGWRDWLLAHAVLWSSIRIVVGFAWAALLAVPLGVLMGTFGKPRAFFEPVRLMGSYLPLPAFSALTIAWWGTTEAQKIGFLAIASFVVLLPQVLQAVEAVPHAHVLSARTLGATRLQQMRYVLYAGAKAGIFRALRLTFAVGWTWVTLAEAVDPKAGLGYVIFLGERRAEHRPHVYVVILVIVALAFLVNTVWARIERWLHPFRELET